jgi:uncharacterized protein (TIGR03435 family)
MGRTFGVVLLSGFVFGTSFALIGQVQTDQKTSTFDVASVKPNTSDPDPASARFTVLAGGRLVITGIPLREIIRVAYQVPEYQLIGGPDWIGESRFDIVAKAEGMPVLRFPPGLDAPGHPVYPMLRGLLADRFKLGVHHETRTLPMYALVLARSDRTLGPQLRSSMTDCGPVNAARGTASQRPPAATVNGALLCGMVGSAGPAGIRLTGDSQSMSVLTFALAGYAGRVVVDRTGLTGLYSFTLEFAINRLPPDQLSQPDSALSFFMAVQEQLGLKLESTSGPADVVVIDHVERPSPD